MMETVAAQDRGLEMLVSELRGLTRTLTAEADVVSAALANDRRPTSRDLRRMALLLDHHMGVLRETVDALVIAAEKADHRQTMLP
jgi:hypothetical protein